jgi:hypothetical protein
MPGNPGQKVPAETLNAISEQAATLAAMLTGAIARLHDLDRRRDVRQEAQQFAAELERVRMRWVGLTRHPLDT